jgi:hypothetical protein
MKDAQSLLHETLINFGSTHQHQSDAHAINVKVQKHPDNQRLRQYSHTKRRLNFEICEKKGAAFLRLAMVPQFHEQQRHA